MISPVAFQIAIDVAVREAVESHSLARTNSLSQFSPLQFARYGFASH